MKDNIPNVNIKPPKYDEIKTDAPDISMALVTIIGLVLMMLLFNFK
jgi:hypothetical protein